jgi:hypothetical protein
MLLVTIYMATGNFCRPEKLVSRHIYGHWQLLPCCKVASDHIYGHWQLLPRGKISESPYIWPLATLAARQNYRVAIYMATRHCAAPPVANTKFAHSLAGMVQGVYHTAPSFHSFTNKNRRHGWLTSVQPALV